MGDEYPSTLCEGDETAPNIAPSQSSLSTLMSQRKLWINQCSLPYRLFGKSLSSFVKLVPTCQEGYKDGFRDAAA